MGDARRLFIHIGFQKTGTSYLQSILFDNQEALAAQGLDIVPPLKRGQFHLMLAVRGHYQEGLDSEAVPGMLDRFSQLLLEAPGQSAIFSQEGLAGASRRSIDTLLTAAGDREVHIILTVRDLARSIPSAWQQSLQSGKSTTFAWYVKSLLAADAKASEHSRRWRQLNAPLSLALWAERVPAERIHVVTVPPPGSPPDTLLRRFCSVLEVDPDLLATEQPRRNTGLGRVQAEVLRLVNKQLPREVRKRQVFGDMGKRFFAVQVLGQQKREPILMPTGVRDRCEAISDQHIRELAAAGYHVSGDLEDLRGVDQSYADFRTVPADEVATSAAAALAEIMQVRRRDVQEFKQREDELRLELAQLRDELRQAQRRSLPIRAVRRAWRAIGRD